MIYSKQFVYDLNDLDNSNRNRLENCNISEDYESMGDTIQSISRGCNETPWNLLMPSQLFDILLPLNRQLHGYTKFKTYLMNEQ